MVSGVARRDMDLRNWLLHLQRTDRLAVAQPGLALCFGVAGLANRLDGQQALIAPEPVGEAGERHHGSAIVSGLLSRRDWMGVALPLKAR